MSELLRAEWLVKEFPVRGGKVHAVTNVSFTIDRGETLGLVGESGCGKSTLGKLLIRLHKPTSGKVFYKGRDINALSDPVARRMGRGIQMIFQDPYATLDPRMSVGATLLEPLSAYRIGKDHTERVRTVRDLMDRVGLRQELFDSYPHMLSGGQRQRVCIARALAPNPDMVVCDEPVSALDMSIQAQILNLLSDLQKERGLTYLFISHDLNVVRYLSDRVAVMFLGQFCEIAPTESLYRKPLHPYTKFLLEAVPLPDPRMRDDTRALLTGEASSIIHPPKGCRFHPRCPYADERCRTVEPPLQEMAGKHFCACHHPLEDREMWHY